LPLSTPMPLEVGMVLADSTGIVRKNTVGRVRVLNTQVLNLLVALRSALSPPGTIIVGRPISSHDLGNDSTAIKRSEPECATAVAGKDQRL
jgi:hypothetical protein